MKLIKSKAKKIRRWRSEFKVRRLQQKGVRLGDVSTLARVRSEALNVIFPAVRTKKAPEPELEPNVEDEEDEEEEEE